MPDAPAPSGLQLHTRVSGGKNEIDQPIYTYSNSGVILYDLCDTPSVSTTRLTGIMADAPGTQSLWIWPKACANVFAVSLHHDRWSLMSWICVLCDVESRSYTRRIEHCQPGPYNWNFAGGCVSDHFGTVYVGAVIADAEFRKYGSGSAYIGIEIIRRPSYTKR